MTIKVSFTADEIRAIIADKLREKFKGMVPDGHYLTVRVGVIENDIDAIIDIMQAARDPRD